VTEEEFFAGLGGIEGCHRLSVAFFRRVEHDDVLRPFYPSLRCPTESIAQFLASLCGQPSRFGVRMSPMKRFHCRFQIDLQVRDRWVAHMVAAIDEVVVDPKYAAPLREFFAEAATQLVNQEEVPSAYAPFPCPTEAHPIERAWSNRCERERLFDAVARNDLAYVQASLAFDVAPKEDLLLHAAENGHLPMMRMLLKSGADARQRSIQAWWSVLHPEAAELMLSHGASPNALTGERPPLIEATRGDKGEKPERVLFLLKSGADANATLPNGQTALHYAARAGFVQIVDLLLQYGACVDAKDDRGATPLDHALRRQKHAVAERLRQANG
jgi:hemoglobin